MDRIPLACMIVSLGCLLIDRSLGGAIDSVYGEREAIAGRRATACDGVRQRRLLRRLCGHEIATRYRTLTTEGAPGPPEAIDVRDDDYGGPCAVSDGADAATIVKSNWTAFDGLKHIYVCRNVLSGHRVRYLFTVSSKKRPRAENRLRHIWRINRMTVNNLVVNRSGASLKKRASPCC